MARRERGRTPAGFRNQLLARLRNYAHERGISVQRVQQRVAFERFLARLDHSGEWVLKGGFALELRYNWDSRPTRDIDLRTMVEPRTALDRLRRAVAESGYADQFSFDLADAGTEMQGAPGGSIRIRVVARVAGIVFTDFHVDVSSGDALVGPPDMARGSDLLAFAGIDPIQFPVYPLTQQLAEKLHAYTLPRNEENTRVKDFVDLVSIAAVERIEGESLIVRLRATFDTRATHPIPETIPEPPRSWADAFARLIRDLPLANSIGLSEGYERTKRFWNPALSRSVQSSEWNPTEQQWRIVI